jgi:gluconate 2-dehydrogenase gamma chain
VSSFDRRSVLLGGLTLGVTAAAGCPPAPESSKPENLAGSLPKGGDAVQPDGDMSVGEVLPILVAVCDRLIPADDLGPGVKAAGAEQYLERALADPRMRAIKSVATRGAVFLQRAARKEQGKAFWELDDAARDALLGRLARNEVRPNGFSPPAFIRIMLALSLEAFLGDPRYGGNKDQIGWNFVGGINWSGRVP